MSAFFPTFLFVFFHAYVVKKKTDWFFPELLVPKQGKYAKN
jgi:hypothetical protein